ncbi:MAG: hypothetical protein NC393_08530 [Clostridium sp.]|nr:hypothetical protein [Clostridium sp.]MCM1207706.1 hypothetical protein [Ruminococcus sp.]
MAKVNRWIWDIDEMWTMHANLKKQKKLLSEEVTKLVNARIKLLDDWKGYAADEYGKLLVFDLERIKEIINGLDKQINDLSTIIEKYYEPCDKEVKQKIIKKQSIMKW